MRSSERFLIKPYTDDIIVALGETQWYYKEKIKNRRYMKFFEIQKIFGRNLTTMSSATSLHLIICKAFPAERQYIFQTTSLAAGVICARNNTGLQFNG